MAAHVVVPGIAVKIMTGARIPPGCDAVVPFEETVEEDGHIRLTATAVHNQHIRFRGEDVAAGTTVVTAGTRLRPPEISMLASFGKALVPVHRRPRVAIVSTGDELIEVGETPMPGKVINSNALALAAALQEIGAEPIILGIARDTRESHQLLLGEGLKADALITSAGVSAGDRDLVREVLQQLGVKQLFWKVDIKPGGPLAFGLAGDKPVFSLPGNPVSTLITFEELVRSALLKMMGHRRVIRPYVTATLRQEVRKKPGKVHFLRVRVEVEDGRYVADTAGDQKTSILRTMVNANGIAVLPKEATAFPAGTEVKVHLLDREMEMLEG
jgi:molybdopterin molybdotransferase